MIDTMILLAALFLPLFPLSMLFNLLFDVARHPVLRLFLLLVWPQIGLWLVKDSIAEIPVWLPYVALGTSLLYGFRALVLRELAHWVSFLATSSWAILWISMGYISDWKTLALLGLGTSIPLGILALLGGHLEKRFGASYAGLYNGLGHLMPRFSGLLVMTILAVIATPVFPGFMTMMTAFLEATRSCIYCSILLCLIWLTWGWASARLIQGFVIGKENREGIKDLPVALTFVYVALLIGLAAFGINLMGHLS